VVLLLVVFFLIAALWFLPNLRYRIQSLWPPFNESARGFWWTVVITLAIAFFVFALRFGPPWMVRHCSGVNAAQYPAIEPKDLAMLADQNRKTLAQIFGGIVLLCGLYSTCQQVVATREGQITERFTRAIDQLGAVNEKGEKKLEMRLGGIYALERIAKDSRKDHWQVMEILTAYVREIAPWNGNKTPNLQEEPPKPATDIQAVLTVLGRRNREYEREDQRLNLSRVDIRGADLIGAHLERAGLREAHLEGADLTFAHLDDSNLFQAHLEGAHLREAHLERAGLREAHLEGLKNGNGAHLEGAFLMQTDMEGAHLYKTHWKGAYVAFANLKGAYLQEADLEGAELQKPDLTAVDLRGARGLAVSQVKAAAKWEFAVYGDELLKELGLPPDHNNKVFKQFSEFYKPDGTWTWKPR
jgi:uncharacterized protein YjbI with pentapeptide repeats